MVILNNDYSIAEITAKQCAEEFIESQYGRMTFIGSTIEQLVRDRAELIYFKSDEPKLYGGTIKYHEKTTKDKPSNYVFINTNHNMRYQYFTLAHELWHLISNEMETILDINLKELFKNDYTKMNERAGDHFAASLMFPKKLVKPIWEKHLKNHTAEETLFFISDLSNAPYEAIAREINELKLLNRSIPRIFKSKLKDFKELDWINERKKIGLSKSPLDDTDYATQFERYSKLVDSAYEKDVIDALSAYNKIVHFDEKLATKYDEILESNINEFNDEVDAF